VLGDDIVIMGGQVADAYVAIMKGLGVQIGAHKSLVSREGLCLEFAKRTFYKGKDVSAVSLAELLVSRKNLSAGLELCRKYSMGLGAYAKFLGYGYKATGSLTKRLWSLPSRLRNYLVAYHGPSMSLFQGVLPWLTMRSLQSTYKVTEGALLKAKELLLGPEVQEVVSRLDRIAKGLCEPFDPDNFEKQGHLIPHGEDLGRFPYHPGIKGIPKDIIWYLDRLVYQDPFVEAMEAVQTLRARVTALGDGVIDHLPELWSALQEIEEKIGAIPSMDRLVATPNLNRLGEGLKLIRRWERLSRPFRSTTK
jgi:glycosyltransferase involved in cell wall biosynthesis